MGRLAVAIALVLACGVASAQPGPPVGSAGSNGPVVVQPPLDAGAPEVSASASPSALMLGGTFTLFVTVAFDAGVEVNLREPLELGPAFEVRRRDSRDTTRPDGKRVRDYQLEVIAWDLGDLRIPPVAVTFTFGGKAGQLLTNAVPIKVSGMLGESIDDDKMRGLAPPTDLSSRDWFWLWVFLGGAAATALIAWYVARRRRRHITMQLTGGLVATQKLDTPGERALRRLLAIETSGLLEREGDRKTGYDAMVDVIREYVGTRYRVATRDLTSAELLRRLGGIAPEQERQLVGAWLERCDVVKYGGLKATDDVARGVLGDARALVLATSAGQSIEQNADAAAAPPPEDRTVDGPDDGSRPKYSRPPEVRP